MGCNIEDSNFDKLLSFFISAVRGGLTFAWAKVSKNHPPGRSVSNS